MNSALVLVIGVAAALIAEAIREAAARAQDSKLQPVRIKNPKGPQSAAPADSERASSNSETTTP